MQSQERVMRLYDQTKFRRLQKAAPSLHAGSSAASVTCTTQCRSFAADGRLRSGGTTLPARRDAIEMEFPLRQHHVADATGLTTSAREQSAVRISLIKISDRSLTIPDPAGFRRVTHMR